MMRKDLERIELQVVMYFSRQNEDCNQARALFCAAEVLLTCLIHTAEDTT